MLPLEDVDPASFSVERLDRMKRESDAQSRFLHGDELIELRKYIMGLETDLEDARDKGDVRRLRDLSKALRGSKAMDAERVYTTALENVDSAESNGMEDEAEVYRQEAMLARQCLPQFQL